MRKATHFLAGACLLASLGAAPAWSQQPPPPAAQQPVPEPPGDPAPPPASPNERQPFASRGTIRTWNYGPDGTINGFALDRNILVMVPPALGATLINTAKLGSRVNVAGSSRSGVNVQRVVDPQTLEINGRTLTVATRPALSPAGPPPGRARRNPPPPPPAPARADTPPPPAGAPDAPAPPPPPARP